MSRQPDSHLTEGTVDHGFGVATARANVGPLKQRFIFPPFSVWDTRDGLWQKRRRLWLAKGIQSELGRADRLAYKLPRTLRDGRPGTAFKNQTSVFDPVVCELVYGWWCPPRGVVIDPFAGGSVRGVVASVLGYRYWGCELRTDQVAANKAQLGPTTTGRYKPRWVVGDAARAVSEHAPAADFIFSCPPYGNLEQYSDDPADLSNLPYEEFIERYTAIVGDCAAKLRGNRFACYVVGNYRDKTARGLYRDLVGETVRAFAKHGLDFYNEIILVNSAGTGSIRAGNTFVRGARKVVKMHQNILVFVKGDPRAAAANIPLDAGVRTGEGKKGDRDGKKE